MDSAPIDPQKQIEEIQKAYEEFQTGMKEVERELRDLVARTIAKIDAKKAQQVLDTIKSLKS